MTARSDAEEQDKMASSPQGSAPRASGYGASVPAVSGIVASAIVASDRGGRGGARRVHDVLRAEILNLELAPGSPLDESLLSERFGLSRTPVREALVWLAADGLVQTIANRSAMVAPIDFLNLPAFFDALTLMYRMTTRLAAEFHGPDDLDRIRAQQEAFRSAVEARDALAMIATNRDLHAAIAEAGRNPYYTALFLRLLDEGRRILRLYYASFDDRLPGAYVEEHDEMIIAIAVRDVDLCDQLATAHADQIVHQIRSHIARDQRRDVVL